MFNACTAAMASASRVIAIGGAHAGGLVAPALVAARRRNGRLGLLADEEGEDLLLCRLSDTVRPWAISAPMDYEKPLQSASGVPEPAAAQGSLRDDLIAGFMFLKCSHHCRMVRVLPPPSETRQPGACMAKTPSFICQNCGAVYGRWQGKCDGCGEWNSIAEEGAAADRAIPGRSARKGRVFALEPLAGETHDAPRLPSGLPKLDRVTGGGFVRGSVLLMAGDPGIGKSTLLIQGAAALARSGHRSVYISGEEAVAQVRLRAERLGLADAAVELAAETSVEDIIATLSQGKTPRLIVIDSIQTMWTDAVESAPRRATRKPRARAARRASPVERSRTVPIAQPRLAALPRRGSPRARGHRTRCLPCSVLLPAGRSASTSTGSSSASSPCRTSPSVITRSCVPARREPSSSSSRFRRPAPAARQVVAAGSAVSATRCIATSSPRGAPSRSRRASPNSS
jgi:hypothetical protein